MASYRIHGRQDGQDYGIYQGGDEEAAVRAMLADAGTAEEPDMDAWIVRAEAVTVVSVEREDVSPEVRVGLGVPRIVTLSDGDFHGESADAD